MKKILHILKTALFAEDFIHFINTYFNSDDHIFILYGEDFVDYNDKSIIKINNVYYYPRASFFLNRKGALEYIKDYDKIIIHSLFEIEIIEFLYDNNYLLNKTVLYFWGGDKIPREYWNLNQKNKYKSIIKNSAEIVTVINEDADSIKANYNPNGKFYTATYGEKLSGKSNMQISDSKILNILVGNSATETNHHFRVFDLLKKFKGECMYIHCPLSYGDSKYAQEVCSYGEELFGDKFIPYLELMKNNEYNDFLKKIDVAIFDIERQQALGNINLLLSYGKKIYLRENTILNRFYRDECGCEVFQIRDIESISFDELKKFESEKMKRNIKSISDFFDNNTTINEWKNIFD